METLAAIADETPGPLFIVNRPDGYDCGDTLDVAKFGEDLKRLAQAATGRAVKIVEADDHTTVNFLEAACNGRDITSFFHTDAERMFADEAYWIND